MFTMSNGGGEESPTEITLAHTHVPATVALSGYVIATSDPWFGAVVPRTLTTWIVTGIVLLAISGWWVWAYRCWRRHSLAMCTRCMTDTPIDGEQQAVRYSRRLVAVHFVPSRTAQLVTCVIVGGATWFTDSAHLWISIPCAGIFVAFFAAVAYLDVSERTHVRLVQWCPICRDHRGWGDEPSPEPMPVPAPEKDEVRL